jgi:hypothetical protein
MNDKIQLKNITIVCIDGVNPDIGLKALKYSMKHIEFGNAKLISHIKPENVPNNIQFVQIDKLSHDSYSSFMLQELHKHVDTDFCLTIHDDGFVINPQLWDDNFLNYDYIGAPWLHTVQYYGQKYRVGNGGFSLRSKKLINLCKNIQSPGHEDASICIRNRDLLEMYGCKFAPVEIAMKFSLEEQIPECEFNLNNTFGFHGRGVPEMDPSRGHYQQFLDRIKLLETI